MIINAVSLFGLILVHYSNLFTFLLLFLPHILIHLKSEKKLILNYISIFSLLMIFFIPFCINLKDSSFISLNMPDASLRTAFNAFKLVCLSMHNEFFWAACGPQTQWYYKKIMILFFFLIPLLHHFMGRRGYTWSSRVERLHIVKVIYVFALSILIALTLFFTLHVIPLFHWGFMHWFVHNYFAGLAASFLIYLSYLIAHANQKKMRFVILLIYLMLPLSYFYYAKDFQHISRKVNHHKISHDELKEVQSLLNRISEHGKCNLITESTYIEGQGWAHAGQLYRALEYYWVISDCRILNGSWFTFPLENSRELFDLPSSSFFASADFEPIYYIGTDETFSRYLSKTNGIRADKLDHSIGGNSIYKIRRDFKPSP